MDRSRAEACTILRGTVGSNALGLALEGTDDRDEMGLVVEPLREVVGPTVFEQFIYRTAAEREGRHDAPSQPGDLDLTLYSLRKWTRLALAGNPSVLLLLFLPETMCSVLTPAGRALRALAPHFVSKAAGRRFLGYLVAQRQRLVGERGGKDVNRRELVAKHGYDTKYAMHMLRLGKQAIEFLETGRMTLPMARDDRDVLMMVREGRVSLDTVLMGAAELEEHVYRLIDDPRSPLPDTADGTRVWAWVAETYRAAWR